MRIENKCCFTLKNSYISLKLSIKFTFLIFYPQKYVKLHKNADKKVKDNFKKAKVAQQNIYKFSVKKELK